MPIRTAWQRRAPPQPAGHDHTGAEDQKRRNEVKGLLPFSANCSHAEEHQIGTLRIGEDTVDDPGIGLEISSRERQQACDMQRLIAGERCLTNTCIAGDRASPALIRQMETGQQLKLEVADTNLLSVSTMLPLGQFASVRNAAPSRTFTQDIDE
jgi:hypothetical protein